MVNITIVIPIHNEVNFLAQAWSRLESDLKTIPAAISVLLVENGSTDDTLTVARQLPNPALTVITLPTADYGAAMRSGFIEASDQDWLISFDIDYFSAPFIRGLLTTEADVVIASKRAPGSDDRRSVLRRTGTLGFNMLLKILFASRVSDTHGIKAFRGEVIRDLIQSTTHTQDLFDTELVLRAERADYRIAEVPIIVEEMREARSSYLKRVPRTVKGLLQLRRSFSSERRKTTSR